LWSEIGKNYTPTDPEEDPAAAAAIGLPATILRGNRIPRGFPEGNMFFPSGLFSPLDGFP
jgi:hypothetical protein